MDECTPIKTRLDDISKRRTASAAKIIHASNTAVTLIGCLLLCIVGFALKHADDQIREEARTQQEQIVTWKR